MKLYSRPGNAWHFERETSPYVRNAAISRHFERDPIPYALDSDWPVEAGGFEPLHFRNQIRGCRSWPETFFGNEERHDKLQLRCVGSNPAAPSGESPRILILRCRGSNPAASTSQSVSNAY